MANVKFFQGQENNLNNLSKKAGQVLLALNNNEGSLYYDIDSNTRIKLNAKNADTANKLTNSRTILTNLGSTNSASFNGTANITPGITGTLSIVHGGTGATTAADARNNLGAAASNHSHNVVTTSANGLMSAADKSKLDGIAANANKYTHPSYTAKSSGLYKITVDSLGHISTTTAVTKSDITALGIPGQDTNTTYSAFKGASTSAAGGSGLVPAPAMGASNRYLRSDGTWQIPPDTNTTYGVATTSANGLMSASDKTKLDGIATGANKYTHPSYTTRSSGLYKITVDSSGHVSGVSAVTKSDITALGIPGQDTNTTYGVATTSANGLMSAADKSKLNGIASGANKYTHPGYTARGSGFYKVTVDSTGHVSSVTNVTKTDITALGIPSTNTTYGVATTSANGLMSASDKTKLDGIATNANNYVHPTSAGNKHIPFGGSSGQVLCWSANGIAEWGNAGSIIYSDTEEDTGNTWLDGRPIYSETVLFSAPTNANATTAVTFNFANIDTAWVDSSSTFFIARDTTTTISHPGYVADTGARLFMAQLRPERNQLLVVTNMAGTAYIRVCYTKISDDPTYYHLPFLHSSNEQNCVITSSSIYSNLYTREYAFNGLTANYWACAVSDTQRWIQVQMPYALRKMMVTLVSPQGSAVTTANVPKTGTFQGSNNGSTWTTLMSCTRHDATAGSTTSHYIANSTGYKYLRIKVTSPSSGPWTGFGDIRIKGEVAS